jgi:hypothetical protein
VGILAANDRLDTSDLGHPIVDQCIPGSSSNTDLFRHAVRILTSWSAMRCDDYFRKHTDAARNQVRKYLFARKSSCSSMKSTNHPIKPSHSSTFPGGTSFQESSSSVQFALAEFRSCEVVTQFFSLSMPPRAMGSTWSMVGYSSQNAGCVKSIFQFGWNGNASGSSRESSLSVPGNTRRSPEYRSMNPSRMNTLVQSVAV